MDTPRSSNGFLTIVCLAILAVCGYKLYKDHQAKTKPVATVAEPTPRKGTHYVIIVSQVIEPYFTTLFSKLGKNDPIDVVPPMAIAKERITDRRARADSEKQVVYDKAIALLDRMIAAGEERTQALEIILREAARPRSALDSPQSSTSSNQHFLEGQVKRLTESLMRHKPAIEKALADLRNAEREHNERLPKNAPTEKYSLPILAESIITVEPETRDNPLEKKAYDQRRATYSWRRAYYDQYGYSQPAR